MKAKERRERAAGAPTSVGPGERLGRLPGEMSGGRRQRVAVARTLAKRPKALLADEPTGSLGEHLRDEVRDVLERVGKKPRLTFVMVTRDSALARTVPRLAPLCEGRITVRENAPA